MVYQVEGEFLVEAIATIEANSPEEAIEIANNNFSSIKFLYAGSEDSDKIYGIDYENVLIEPTSDIIYRKIKN